MKKIKKILFNTFIIYNIAIVIAITVFNITGIDKYFIKYISFNTNNINFQDLLSMLVTILSIFIGAIITVATILISMCDKRIMKLIKLYGATKYLISCIKKSIFAGIFTIIFLSCIYARLYPNYLIITLSLIYISGLLFFIFIRNSLILVRLVLSLLDSAFDDNNSAVINSDIKINNKNKD